MDAQAAVRFSADLVGNFATPKQKAGTAYVRYAPNSSQEDLRVIRNDGIVCVFAFITFNGEGSIEVEEAAHG
jgi:hypothetical protein